MTDRYVDFEPRWKHGGLESFGNGDDSPMTGMPNHERPDELAELRRRVEHLEKLAGRLADSCHTLDMRAKALDAAIQKLRGEDA